jgi:hypothetical protein
LSNGAVICDIYLTAVGLTPGGSSTVHIYTQTIQRSTQIEANLEECGPCPIFANFTLAFALQLTKKHGKTLVRVRRTSVRVRRTSVSVRKTSEYSVQLPKHAHITKHPHTHTKPTDYKTIASFPRQKLLQSSC